MCASADLADRGRAVAFDVLHFRRPVRAFALRVDGAAVAYLNRCGHVPAELDWQPGEFWDAERRHLVCSIHGAVYEPGTGACVGGPCRTGLVALDVSERDGTVWWRPGGDIRAPAAAP